MRKAVKVIAILATVGSAIYFIISCVQLSHREILWGVFIITIISLALNLVLLWALHNALARVESLEKDVYKLNDKQKTINNRINDSNIFQDVEEDSRPYKQCKACGAIVRTNEDKCPKCNLPYDD